MKNSPWLTIVTEWSKRFDIPLVIDHDDNLTKTKAVKICVACKSKDEPNRHHKAHDFYFACLRPDLYARDYMEFKDEDIDILCRKCHKAFHKALDPQIRSANIFFKRHGKSKDNCDKWRAIFLQFYTTWLDRRRTHNPRQLHKPRVGQRKKKSRRNSRRNINSSPN